MCAAPLTWRFRWCSSSSSSLKPVPSCGKGREGQRLGTASLLPPLRTGICTPVAPTPLQPRQHPQKPLRKGRGAEHPAYPFTHPGCGDLPSGPPCLLLLLHLPGPEVLVLGPPTSRPPRNCCHVQPEHHQEFSLAHQRKRLKNIPWCRHKSKTDNFCTGSCKISHLLSRQRLPQKTILSK